MTQYTNTYGTVYSVRDYKGEPRIMCRAKDSRDWLISSTLAVEAAAANTIGDLQQVLDNHARAHGWQPLEGPASAVPPEIVDECSESEEECPYLHPLGNSKKYSWQCSLCGDKFVNREICNKSFRGCGWYQDQQEKYTQQDDEEEPSVTDSCQCRTCEHESCFAHGCTKECPANAEESCLTTSCPEYAEGKDSQCKVKTESVPTMDAAAITDERAAKDPFKAEETSTTSAIAADAGTSLPESSCKSGPNLSPAPASPADAGVAAQNLCAAEPASLEAKDINVPAFDYSGLDDQTVADLHLAEREYMRGRKLAEVGLRRMADGVAMAHDALCSCDNLSQLKHGNRGESSFGAWCDSVGLNRKAAERLLQVARLFDNSTPREQKVLEELGPSLLYAAAKHSAPAELVQAVRDGDITTHKQYQEALAEIRARDAKITDLLDMSEAADRRADKAEQAAKDTARERDAALRRAAEAENRAAGAQKLADQRGDENTALKAQIRELESRPVEVAVAQPGEEQIEAWRKEGEDRAAAALQDRLRKADQAKADAQRQVNALQTELAAARPDADACQRTVDTLYETTENLRLLLRTQLRQAQLTPADYGNVVAHVLLVANALRDTVRNCAPAGYTMDSEEDDDFE